VKELAAAVRLGESPRVSGYLGLGLGRYAVEVTEERFFEAALTAALDVRIAPPLALRLSMRYQEVFDGNLGAADHIRAFVWSACGGFSFPAR
jgi:hypothetical protein